MTFEVDNSPEGLVQQAEDLLNFNNEKVLKLYLQAYESEEADESLKAKIITRALPVAATLGDEEQTKDLIIKLFDAYNNKLIDDFGFEETLRDVLSKVQTSESGTKAFISLVSAKLNVERFTNLYIDIRLRECDLALAFADYPKAREIIQELIQYCPYPPDPKDSFMVKAAIRILVFQIDLADTDNDEKAMFEAYENAKDFPTTALDNRQKAILLKIEGLKAYRTNNIVDARTKFFEAFKLFESAGSEKRISCIPYFGLATMLLHEKINALKMPELIHYQGHPLVAPIAQLLDAYQDSDIVTFNQRTPSALAVFQNDPLYKEKIEEIRQFVLQKAVISLCAIYNRVKIDYLAEIFKSDPVEVKDIVLHLILDQRINALLENDSGILNVYPLQTESTQLAGLDALISKSEASVKAFLKRSTIKI